ncbi:uncharacterized protein UDID_18568 [Ustilago sp. UG-2017a]|nr:uncharacterized protein UDID_18568 [Ustilago sp. UG-2017a]
MVEDTETRTKGSRKGKNTQVRVDNDATNENEPEAINNETDEDTDSDSDFDDGDKRYNFRTLAKLLEPVPKLTSRNYYSWSAHVKSFLRSVPHAMKHLEGTYDKKHPKWSRSLDDALINALRGTIDTTGEYNVNYLVLDVIKEYLTFNQVWRKIENGLTNEATKTSHRLALISQLNDTKMFHLDARKLIQEIRSIQTESSLLGKPFADDTLFSALQKCTIRHPVYKETVATVHQIDFNTLATALSIRQTAVESVPAQKIDPRQASTRTTGNDDQNERAGETEAEADNSHASSRNAGRPRRIRCWICKRLGHGISQCDALEVWCSLTLPLKWQDPSNTKETAHWILDSGASYHMVNDYSMLIHPRTCRKRIITAGSEVLEAAAIGDASISTDYGEIPLQNVLYVKHLNVNLLSTNSLTDEGAQVILDTTGGQIFLTNGMTLKIAKNRERGLLEFRGDTWQESAMATSAPLFEGVDEEFEHIKNEPKVSKQQLWHERLGHPGRDKTKAITSKLKDKHTMKLDPNTTLTCEQCLRSKSTSARMGKGSSERAVGPLDLIHVDLIIDSSHVTEYTCTLVLVDDHSKYVYAQPLTRKGHAFMQLKRIVSFLETQTDRKLKAIRSDQGTEWKSNDALEWSLEKDIEWQTTVGYNSKQNGRVERMNRTLGEKMRTLLMQRRLPKKFWPYAIRAVAFKIKLTPSVDNEFPYQAMFGKSPEQALKLLRVFGCLAWVNVPKVKRDNKKLDHLERKGWLFYSPDYNPNMFWSNSAKFMESKCWSDRTEWRPVDTKAPPVMMTEENFEDLGYNKENIFDETDEGPLQEYMDMETDSEERLSGGTAEVMEQGSTAETQIDSEFFGLVATRPEHRKNLDPTIHEAMSGEDRKHWEEAMRKELDGLEAMGMWEIADLPKGANTVDTRWVLKIKTDANLVPTKFKARLVARGFTQREGIDYTEVFAPVAPIQSIRGVIAVTAVRDWEIDSIDVKQAYLNSTIHHDVYLKPPVGIKIPPGKALKVVKGLYGLKQSGREWNIELDSHLRTIGFHCMPSAPCLYSRGTGDKITIITAYVDDMLITSPSRDEVNRTKREIMDKWETQDNGRIKEFLGIKITRDRRRRRISLGLTAYIKEMVNKWLGGANEKSWVPMLSVANVAGGERCEPQRAKKYQELVGQLLWVSNTARPDIAFAIGVLSRYMSIPIDSAWKAAIHVVKYLNQTNEYQLHLGGETNEHSDTLVATTSGSITYVYGCPVSWKSHVQKCVALSAVEAEFVAASEAVRETLFFSYLLRDLEITDVRPVLYTDSQGCIQVSKDPAKHWKLKHIDTRYHFVRDHVQEGDVAIKYVGTANNVADVLTKPLQGLNTSRLARMIGLEIPPKGGVEDASASQARCTCHGRVTGVQEAYLSEEHK